MMVWVDELRQEELRMRMMMRMTGLLLTPIELMERRSQHQVRKLKGDGGQGKMIRCWWGCVAE
jgi:hypothetical protein